MDKNKNDNKEDGTWRDRDWKWIVGILITVIIFILSFKFWGKDEPLTELISITGGISSLVLAIIAILIALTESVKSNQILSNISQDIISTERSVQETRKEQIHSQKRTEEKLIRFYEGLMNQKDLSSTEEGKWGVMPQPKAEKSKDVEKGNDTPKVQHKDDPMLDFKKRDTIVKRGDVYFADLGGVVGVEQGGIRPVVVISNNISNRFSPTISVAAITAQMSEARLPTHVELDAALYGFERDSVILLEQIKAIDKARLSDKITNLDSTIMEKIDKAIHIQLGLLDS